MQDLVDSHFLILNTQKDDSARRRFEPFSAISCTRERGAENLWLERMQSPKA